MTATTVVKKIGTAASSHLFDTLACSQLAPPERGFLLRDVAQNSDFMRLQTEALAVRLETTVVQAAGDERHEVTLTDLSGRDRALTLVYTVPLPSGPARWLHHPRLTLDADTMPDEFMNVGTYELGANGKLSAYPFGAVTIGDQGYAIGLDPTTPLCYRIGYQAATRELFLACDLGLAPEKSLATFRFVVFNFAARHLFRGALARYYALYPAAFERRIERQGVWMPFAPISKVEGWEDFGFRFKEGDDETAWDDAHDILTFRYTEPMTWWQRLSGDAPRTVAHAAAEAERLAAEGDRRALAWRSSAYHDEQGEPYGQVRDLPWCDGVVWSLNSAPGVAGEVTDFKNKWNVEYSERQYGASRSANCDGEYIDSGEAYVTAELNFRRDHFATIESPLCYALESRQVGIHKGMICFEYVRALRAEMEQRGRYMMANGTPIGWFWLAPLLDIMGTEADWKPHGEWEPMTPDELLYRRALCYQKPYCFLMNTNFANFGYDDSERFMKLALAYGMFPGYFSANAATGHYFANPALYNRDRPLFKKYIPLCRLVAEAGWQPLTVATSSNPTVPVEQFGHEAGKFYLTLHNESVSEQTTCLTLHESQKSFVTDELVHGGSVEWRDGQTHISLSPYDTLVLDFNK